MKFHKIKNRRGLNGQFRPPDHKCEEIFWEFPSSGRTRSLWSWSDSHTNPLKITKNEISPNQKSPQIGRYFLRPWLWIRRDFLKIPIQRPTLSVSREGGAIPYTKKCKKDVSFYQKMQKRVFVWPINAKEMFLFTKKCQKDASFSKIGERDAFFY